LNEGVYCHQLDAKNRMRIPAKIREEFVNGYTLTLAPGGCLAVISREESEKRRAMFAKISPYDPVALEAARSISIWTWDAEEDNQGRIIIPQHLRSKVGIVKNVVTVKTFYGIELWAEEEWNKKLAQMENENLDNMFVKLNEAIMKYNG
jgi:MraZ protein